MKAPGNTAQRRDARGRWTKGTSGNPRGRRPARDTLTTQLRNRADEPAGADGQTRAERLAEVVWNLALGGERWATELIYNRLEGRAPLADLAAPDLLFIASPLPGPAAALGDDSEGADE